MYFSKSKMYLSKLHTLFVQIVKCICLGQDLKGVLKLAAKTTACIMCKMYLSKLQNTFVQIVKCFCPNYKSICPNCEIYMSGVRPERRLKVGREDNRLHYVQNIFVQIAKYVCPNCRNYLSKL